MKIVKAMPLFAMGTMALGLVGATVLAPVANAEVQSQGAPQTVQVEVGSKLTLTLGEGTVKGTANGAEVKTSGTVESNAAKGFTVTVKDADDKNAMLLSGNEGANSGIPALPNADTTDLGWSVVLNNEKKAMPKSTENALEVTKTSAPQAAATTFNVGYIFKVNNSIQSGTYVDTVTYTATANS